MLDDHKYYDDTFSMRTQTMWLMVSVRHPHNTAHTVCAFTSLFGRGEGINAFVAHCPLILSFINYVITTAFNRVELCIDLYLRVTS